MGRKKLSRGWWWGSLCFVLGYVWFLYWISGIRLTLFFMIFVFFLLGWTLLDLFALVLKMRRRWKEGKTSRVIELIVKRLDFLAWLLGLFVLITGVWLGWMRLMELGVMGFWMDALLILGVLVIIAYTSGAFSRDEST
jgi:small-conductance mechanosensitive channel